MLWNAASSKRGINELSEPLVISFERSCRSGELLKKQKKENVVSVFQKIEITITRKAKRRASHPSKGSLVLYFTHKVHVPPECHIEGVPKEEKIAKLSIGQWPNRDMEEEQLSASRLPSGKTMKNLKVHLQCRKPHPRGQCFLPKRRAPCDMLDFLVLTRSIIYKERLSTIYLTRTLPYRVTETGKSVTVKHMFDIAGNSSAYKSDSGFYEHLLKSWWWGCYFITE